MKGLLNLAMILCLVGCEYETAPEDLVPGSGSAATNAASSCEDNQVWTDTDGNPCSAFAELQEYCSVVAGAEANCPVSCGLCVPAPANDTRSSEPGGLCADNPSWTDSDGNPCSAFAALQEFCSQIVGAADNCPLSCGLCP